MVARVFEFALSGFVDVELAIDDNVLMPILTGNGLVSGREIYDAQPRVTQTY